MKIVVTGALGQLGTEIMKLARSSSHEFVFTDVGESPYVTYMDITDPASVDAVVGDDADVIINCAAYTDTARAEKDPQAALRLNADAVGVLSGAALKADALLMHISTDYVFDGTASEPYAEDAEVHPVSVYGLTKAEGERIIAGSGCRHMIFRTSWLYSGTGRNFVRTMIEKTASLPEVRVVADQTGCPTYAGDLAAFLMYILDNDMTHLTGLYHYSNEGSCSWYEFACGICALSGNDCHVSPCRSAEFPSPVRRPAYSVLDKGKVRRTFGVEIPHWRESLEKFMTEYLNK